MQHSPGFLKLVNEERLNVKEITVEQARERLARNPQAVLLDVREDSEWEKEHAEQAVHLGKGVLERDLETMVPDPGRELIMYCGGGYRSVLTASVAQRMGYRNVFSLIGGYKALLQAHWPMSAGVRK
jgi:rhodanese-related sulfurtransferase